MNKPKSLKKQGGERRCHGVFNPGGLLETKARGLAVSGKKGGNVLGRQGQEGARTRRKEARTPVSFTWGQIGGHPGGGGGGQWERLRVSGPNRMTVKKRESPRGEQGLHCRAAAQDEDLREGGFEEKKLGFSKVAEAPNKKACRIRGSKKHVLRNLKEGKGKG